MTKFLKWKNLVFWNMPPALAQTDATAEEQEELFWILHDLKEATKNFSAVNLFCFSKTRNNLFHIQQKSLCAFFHKKYSRTIHMTIS